MPLQFLRAPTLRHSILWLLASLLLVFLAGMTLLSHLNLTYSKDAVSDLRRQQIKEVVSGGLARIDARQSALASYTVTLANIGESFYRLSDARSSVSEATLKSDMENALKQHLEDFEGASGAGLWFEPGVLADGNRSYMPYYTLDPAKPSAPGQPVTAVPERLDTESRFGKYRNSPWFSRTLGPDWQPDPQQAGTVYWSPVFFDLNTKRALLALASPMYNRDGRLLGIATTAWSADQIIDLVSEVSVTDQSFAFLNDRNNRNLSSLSQGEDNREEQALIDAILGLNLAERLPEAASSERPPLTTQQMMVNGRDYELYFAGTAGGMVYGAGVPEDEINAVLRTMVSTNKQILLGTAGVLLIISVFLIWRIVRLIRELQASYTDELTGLPNRVRLQRDLQTREGAALFILNLDRFNQINSLLGTACGDHVLLVVAARLASLRRGVESRTIYRLPGDEFALLTSPESQSAIEELAADMRTLVTDQRVYWENQPLTLDASVGVAIRQERRANDPADQLISQATTAILRARQQGRHQLLYDPLVGIEETFENNLNWANRLKEAIDEERLIAWFQPIHDNQLDRVTKFECLVRMVEGNGDVISASRFVDIANKLRLNRTLTAVMLEQCFREFSGREEEFSLNLSYGDIAHQPTVKRILDALDRSGIGDRVIFEILESDGIANYDEIRSFIEQVKPYGCRIAIDDFGTGYSNFAHLLSLHVDFIKIDGSLIRHLHEDQTAFLVTRGIVQFARSLNIRTVAEFVHNEQVQARVKELGIDFSQGEYFGMARPSP